MKPLDDNDSTSALLADVLEARHDVVALAAAHRMTPEALAAWAGRDATQRTLHGLCVLADVQTQLMLSRCRTLAVTRLVQQATQTPGDNGEPVSAEQARKACVDLLKLEMKRAERADRADTARLAGEADEDEAEGDLRAVLYGEAGMTNDE